MCPTLCDPIDGSPPGSSVLGILQARTLEWVAISFSNAWNWKVKVKSLSRVRPLATPWTAAYQALPSMGFSRQEYWSGLVLQLHWDMINYLRSSFLLHWYSVPSSMNKREIRYKDVIYNIGNVANMLEYFVWTMIYKNIKTLWN